MPIVVKRTGTKVPGLNWSGSDRPGYIAKAFNDSAIKNAGGSWFRVAHNTTSGKGQNPDGRPLHTPHMTNPDEHIKLGGSWFPGYRQGQGPRNHGSKSVKRKMASAMIAKIPLPLARHIAATWHPQRVAA